MSTKHEALDARARPREFEFELGYTTDTRRKWMLQPELQTVIYGDGGTGTWFQPGA